MNAYKYQARKRLANGWTKRTTGFVEAPSMMIALKALKMQYAGQSVSVWSKQT